MSAKKTYGDLCAGGHILTLSNTNKTVQVSGHVSLICKECKSANDRKRRPTNFKLNRHGGEAQILQEIDRMVPGSGDLLTRVRNMIHELQFVGNVG